MNADRRTPRFPWVLTLLSGLLFAVLIWLGVWQVQRLAWKEGLIAEAGAAAELPAAPAHEILDRQGGAFRRVILDCPGLASAPFVELRTLLDGRPGVRLISACRPAGSGTTVLVDRGFVAEEISARPPVDAASTASTAPARVVAVVREAPRPNPMAPPPEGGRFFARDQQAMAQALGVEGAVDPRVLYAETSTNPEWRALTPSAPPAAFSNNHLGYAITWFGLALALIVFYGLLLRRHGSPAPTGSDPD